MTGKVVGVIIQIHGEKFVRLGIVPPDNPSTDFKIGDLVACDPQIGRNVSNVRVISDDQAEEELNCYLDKVRRIAR
ncbi:hypothetical protein KJ713_03180 [Patescibacteria group bacterium]|nr:hypothetical protein [Patescibacteria group bacterium]